MRLLHIVPSYLPARRYGGTIVAVHGLCAALAAAGHEVHVLTTSVDGPEDSPVPLGVPVPIDGVQVRYFASRALRRLFWSRPLGRAAHAAVAGFDAVHLHSIFLWPTAAGARAARGHGVPYVLSPRGMLERSLVRRRSRVAKSLWLALVERRNLEGAAAVHFTSERERREAAGFGYRLQRAVVIPNGVDARGDAGGDRPVLSPGIAALLEESEPYLLFLGRLSWKKGLDRLVAALKGVEGVRCVVAGNDDEGYRPVLERLVGAAGAAGRFHVVGAVHGADKTALLSGALALVLPSYSENFGNVVLEAMAAGCPPVVTPEVGAAEIVAREECGIVVDGEPAALGAALRGLVADRRRRDALGARGREAVSRYTWAAVAAKMVGVYGEVSRMHDGGRLAAEVK